jgi:hypothetical protein
VEAVALVVVALDRRAVVDHPDLGGAVEDLHQAVVEVDLDEGAVLEDGAEWGLVAGNSNITDLDRRKQVAAWSLAR